MFLDLITGFLSLYLAFTNALADQIMTLLPIEEPIASMSEVATSPTAPTDSTLTELPSDYETGGTIPQILIDNAAWQQAAVAGVSTSTTAATPIDALVNIYCTYESAEYIRATTGTGFFVDSRGIILTNAHVAQFLLIAELLEDGSGECVVRTGSPATDQYQAELLYMSPAWLREHAALFKAEDPKGTGERDYALLYVNGSLTDEPLPQSFPALALDTNLLSRQALESEVSVHGYPAQTLFAESNTDLVVQSGSTTIGEFLTFGSNYADLMTIGGTAVGQQGASGGPVVDGASNVIGVVVTRGDDSLYGAGSLRAITLSYINRTMLEETGVSLIQNLTGDLNFRSDLYRRTMVPFLKTILRWELE